MNKTPIILEFQRDGRVHLSFGYFTHHTKYTHTEIERGYNIFGEPLTHVNKRYTNYRVLRSGEGIKVSNQNEVAEFLDKFLGEGNYSTFNSDLLHKKFFADSDTLY